MGPWKIRVGDQGSTLKPRFSFRYTFMMKMISEFIIRLILHPKSSLTKDRVHRTMETDKNTDTKMSEVPVEL